MLSTHFLPQDVKESLCREHSVLKTKANTLARLTVFIECTCDLGGVTLSNFIKYKEHDFNIEPYNVRTKKILRNTFF